MKTRTKIILGVIAFILIAQHQLGRYVFEQECQANEGAWVKPIEPANSIAYDRLGTSYKLDGKGFNIARVGNLIHDSNRREFVELYVYEPSSEFLSAEPGWYRYWLALRSDPACTAFYASKTMQENWHAYLADSKSKEPSVDSDAVCIASKKITAPESRYVEKVRSNVDMRSLGLGITSYDIFDRHSNEIRIHLQRTTYFGPWLYEVLNWLAGHLTDSGLSHEYCRLPPESYAFPSEAYHGPKSMLGSLASEGWPMLPFAPNSPK